MRSLQSLSLLISRLSWAVGQWTSSSYWRSLRVGAFRLGWSIVLIGCGDVQGVAPAAAPITDPTQLYMSLTLGSRALVLSTYPGYETRQLVATPRDAQGNPMAGLPAPTFRSSDTSRVQVTADGKLTALLAGTRVNVIASLSVGPVTHVDTVRVDVTADLAPPPVLGKVAFVLGSPNDTLQPMYVPERTLYGIRPELALQYLGFALGYISISFGFSTQATVTDTAGNVLSIPVDYQSIDSAVATVNASSGLIKTLRPGKVRIVAQTTAYGVTKADTVTYTLTMPLVRTVYYKVLASGAKGFLPDEVRISPNGTVIWANYVADTADVVFDDPANVVEVPNCDALLNAVWSFDLSSYPPYPHCGAGNIQPLYPNPQPNNGNSNTYPTIQLRQFPVAGVYPFHNTRTGASGRVVVTAEALN